MNNETFFLTGYRKGTLKQHPNGKWEAEYEEEMPGIGYTRFVKERVTYKNVLEAFLDNELYLTQDDKNKLLLKTGITDWDKFVEEACSRDNIDEYILRDKHTQHEYYLLGPTGPRGPTGISTNGLIRRHYEKKTEQKNKSKN